MNGEQDFTITHPFHPLCGHTFPLLAQRFAWGEERVFFFDPGIHPLLWKPEILGRTHQLYRCNRDEGDGN